MLDKGMRRFTIIWLGQVVSLVGTAMTQFALIIWLWQETGQATTLALMSFFVFAPAILFSPLAGVLVDRFDRKLVMMLSDLGAGLASIVVFVLLITNTLAVWHLYALATWTSAFAAFQFPAYSAAISTMLNKKQYARASGMLSVAESGAGIAAPIVAGALLAFIGLRGILLVDIATFLMAISILALMRIPKHESGATRLSLWQDFAFGFRYIWQHKPLLAVQTVFFAFNVIAGFSFFMVAPLILARTGGSELTLASVQSAAGTGGLVGAALLIIWGGPKRRVHGVLLSMAVYSVFGGILLGLGQTLVVWLIAAFLMAATVPVMNGSNQALWQSKVPPVLQGRVFATRRLIAQLSMPVAMLAAGVSADYLFEPATTPGGALTTLFGGLVGVGAGAGTGLMIVLSGILGLVIVGIAYATPGVTQVEALLADHDETL